MRLDQLRKDYCLLEAFEALGEWLYGDDWTGNEQRIERSHVTDPDEMRVKRAPLRTELEDADAEYEAVRAKKLANVVEAVGEKLESRLTELTERRMKLNAALYENPEPSKGLIEDWDAWNRRQKTEEILIGGLASGDIRAICVGGLVVENYLWAGEWGFKYYLNLSMVLLPQLRSDRKRNNVRIPETDFEKWIDTIIPENPAEAKKLSAERQCEIWLREQSRVGRQPKPKEEFLIEAQALFEGLSERAFDRAWINSVPESWTARGRRVWNI